MYPASERAARMSSTGSALTWGKGSRYFPIVDRDERRMVGSGAVAEVAMEMGENPLPCGRGPDSFRGSFARDVMA
jgi:hypothetical protein